MSSVVKELIEQAERMEGAIKEVINQVGYEQSHKCDTADSEEYYRLEDALDNLSAALESIKDAKGYLQDANQN